MTQYFLEFLENFYAVAELDPPASNTSSTLLSTSNTFNLVSPTVWPTATENCFTFKVRPGSLDFLQVADSNGIELYKKKIDAKLDRGNSLESWSRVVVSLPRVVEPLHDCFHGDDELNCQERGNSSILVVAAGPTTPTTSAPPPTTTFTESQENYCDKNEYSCQGRAGCIPISWLCDGTKECAFGDDEENCPEKKVKFMKNILVEKQLETTTTTSTTTMTTTTSITTTLETSTTTTEKMKPENKPENQELPEFFDDFVEHKSNSTNEVILKSHKNSTEDELEIIKLVRVAPPKPDSVKGTFPSLILLLLGILLF
ncbi:unnamed protein product [Oikopleura dioica]|uniref:MAM domain-containing protein n=1 Tax=Oikopleura dioica TaxID=34765 RepID=E4YAX5_OIKDI|nr:unnamed protein product [Oikopleura dioica]